MKRFSWATTERGVLYNYKRDHMGDNYFQPKVSHFTAGQSDFDKTVKIILYYTELRFILNKIIKNINESSVHIICN